MTLSRRAQERRLRRALDKAQIVFIKVGGRACEDRCIDRYVETREGATVANPEYTALIRGLVEAVMRPPRSRR